eukprot:15350497-Ditylum_brightwellii.AAC.1
MSNTMLALELGVHMELGRFVHESGVYIELGDLYIEMGFVSESQIARGHNVSYTIGSKYSSTRP